MSVAAQQLDSCPILHCPVIAELEKVPLSLKKSKLIELTPTIATDMSGAPHSGQCVHGGSAKAVWGSSVESALPTASRARAKSLRLFP